MVEHQTCDGKVIGSNPGRSGGRSFFSRVSFLCWLLFQYMFHHHVTAVAHKRSRLCCQKSSWQVTARHTCTLRMRLQIKMGTLNWYMVLWHTQNLHQDGSSFSHITTEQCCNHFSVDIQSALCKATVTHSELHTT